MPLVKIDYDAKKVSNEELKQVIEITQQNLIETFNSSDGAISIFLYPYHELAHSTQAIELEVGAKVSEFYTRKKNFDEAVKERLASLTDVFENWKKEHSFNHSIVLTMCPYNWQPKFLE